MATGLQRMITAQPDVLEHLATADLTAEVSTLRAADRIIIVGTGTSFHAAELGALLYRGAGVDAISVPAVEAARGCTGSLTGAAYVIISHTGSTSYARSLRKAVQAARRPLVTITGQRSGWAEAIKTPAEEASETYTVSYTAALAVLGLLGHQLAGTPTGPDDLRRAAGAVRDVISEPAVAQISVPARALAIVGADSWAITAREGALKIREAARILAEGFDPERLLHGAAVPYTAEDVLIGLQPDMDPDGLTSLLLDAARAEGITTYVLADQHADLHPFLRQLPATVRLQLLASLLADAKGTDPDVAITGAWAREALWSSGDPTGSGQQQ
ncbi:MAG: SIS domain-containing protein [Acidimicrobiales bacterium]